MKLPVLAVGALRKVSWSPEISHAIPVNEFQMLQFNRWYSAGFEAVSIRVVGGIACEICLGWVL